MSGSENVLTRYPENSRTVKHLPGHCMKKEMRSAELQVDARYSEKYTISLMPAYEHTIFGTVTREQKTTYKKRI
jgi:hypothetical protein